MTCIGWLKESEPCQIVVSADLKGNIFKYNLVTSVHNRYYPESNKPITQLSTHPDRPITAFGYKHGTILVIDMSVPQLNILYRLKTHEDAINCLIWTSRDVIVSSSEDKWIRVWKVSGEQGEELKCIRAPGSSGGPGGANRPQQTINYTPLCAPKPDLLLTASYK